MGLDRRTFLQQAGLTLFSLGAANAGMSSFASDNSFVTSLQKYQQALAQPTSRKLALLIGINNYAYQDDLSGCLMDVELQRELLIHRFGFNPQDILILSDRQATRENIETAFLEHLTQQAQAGDVVVFHFSGYGGQVKMPLSSDAGLVSNPETDADFRLANSFIPVDGLSSTKKSLLANSILRETLLVLAQTLSTDKCTFILDTSFNHVSPSKHGSFKVRSISQVADKLSSQELAFLDQLRQKFSSKGLKPSKRLLSLPGVVLSATSNNQVAVERYWDGLSAGLFTQALTQHLWHITPSSKVQVALSRTAESVEQVMGRKQQPMLNSPDKSAIAYYLAVSDAPNAVGIISKVSKGDHAEVKLLGLPANIMTKYGVNSCFSLAVADNAADHSDTPQLQIKSKEGLIAKTHSLSATKSLQVGQLVQESIRMLNRNLSLNLALDEDLNRVERVDATSALANIAAINSVVVAKEQNADCSMGKIPADNLASSESDSDKKPFTYGLYSAGGYLIGKTVGVVDEAVKVAVERLRPQFDNLLAAKWLELTSNEFSSQIKVSANILTPEVKAPLWQRATLISANQTTPARKPIFAAGNLTPEADNNVPLIAKGTEIGLKLTNNDSRQLYTIVLGTDVNCNLYALYTPAQAATAEGVVQLEDIAIAPQTELAIPAQEDAWQWKVPEAPGINTLYVLLSTQPFNKTLQAFASQKNFQFDRQQILNVTNPTAVIKAMMQDLHNASSVDSKLLPSEDVYALDVNSWATLKFVYEVTNDQQPASNYA